MQFINLIYCKNNNKKFLNIKIFKYEYYCSINGLLHTLFLLVLFYRILSKLYLVYLLSIFQTNYAHHGILQQNLKNIRLPRISQC